MRTVSSMNGGRSRAAPMRVLACGAYLKNRACLLDGDQVVWSPVHGDLGDADNCIALERSVDRLLACASGPIHAVAHDLHPDFHSTRVALAVAHEHQVPAIAVQHHHAHIGVVLAEHRIDQPVIGLALDGTGLGDDGQIWGGEVLLSSTSGATPGTTSDTACSMRRIDHLAPLAMPGADAAAREPWRLGAAVLHALGRSHDITPRYGEAVGKVATGMVQTMLQQNLQCPYTTSAGRWFDAAAAALGLCTRQTFEAEAAITLQDCAQQWLQQHPGFTHPWESLDLYPLFDELFALGMQGRAAQTRGAAMFHLALAGALAHQAARHAQRHGAGIVVLGGGCFVNPILRQSLTTALNERAIPVFLADEAGCGDAGLALGQAWIAAQSLPITNDTGCDSHFATATRTATAATVAMAGGS
jgi:hydrogenase maturation protein HypF